MKHFLLLCEKKLHPILLNSRHLESIQQSVRVFVDLKHNNYGEKCCCISRHLGSMEMRVMRLFELVE